MTRSLRLPLVETLFVAVVVLGGWRPAVAADECRSDRLNTYQRAKCYENAAAEAKREMTASYEATVATIRRSWWNPGVQEGFVQELARSQQAWTALVAARCEFDADATGGSAGAWVEPMCVRDMTRDRTKYLDEARREFE